MDMFHWLIKGFWIVVAVQVITYFFFLNSCYDAYGIEFSFQALKKFSESHPLRKNRVNQGDLEAMPFCANSFDIVLFNEVLEHVPDDGKALSEAFRVLKVGGFVAIFSPNRLYPFETHGVKLKSTNRNLPIYTPFVPYVPLALGKLLFSYCCRNYWPNELQHLVRLKGFNILQTGYVWQTFENISGVQPTGIKKTKILLRKISNILEKTPILQVFGVSQFILAIKPEVAK